MAENKFNRIEMYDMGLYGIWTDGFRDTHKELKELLGLDELKDKFGYISKGLDYVVIDVGVLLPSRGQRVDFALVNKNKQSTEIGIEALIQLIGLRERKTKLSQEEILDAWSKLNEAFREYRRYFID